MKILVCGSRTWTSRDIIRRELAPFPKGTIVVHGGNGYFDREGRVIRGADMLADEVARDLGFPTRIYEAEWKRLGFGAGPARNLEMLHKEHPDADGVPIQVVLAFSQMFTREFAPGTSGMIRLAEQRGIAVRKVSA
jgi:hypothetical protein